MHLTGKQNYELTGKIFYYHAFPPKLNYHKDMFHSRIGLPLSVCFAIESGHYNKVLDESIALLN
jgi:hypothetical protein